MKYKTVLKIIALTCAMFILASCDKSAQNNKADNKVIKVAVHLPMMIDLLDVASDAIEDGYFIEQVKVNDNVQYNALLKNKEVDANFAQHEPYMQAYNKANHANLVVIAPIYDTQVGFYSKTYRSIDELPFGAKIAIPNDISNEGRALAILNQYDLIKLKDGAGYLGTVNDIVENPKQFTFLKLDLLNLASAYDEKGIALMFNYPSYIKHLHLTPKDALFLEKKGSPYFDISLVAREDNKNSDKIRVLKNAMTSEKVREFLIEKHGDNTTISF